MLNKVIDVSMEVFLFGDVTGYTTTLIETFILVVWWWNAASQVIIQLSMRVLNPKLINMALMTTSYFPVIDRWWSDELLGDKEIFEPLHLPETDREQEERLHHGPPQHGTVCVLTDLPEDLLLFLLATTTSYIINYFVLNRRLGYMYLFISIVKVFPNSSALPAEQHGYEQRGITLQKQCWQLPSWSIYFVSFPIILSDISFVFKWFATFIPAKK